MSEQPQPDPVPIDDPPPHPAEPLQIDTPVIHMQDLEHQPSADTRVSNKGVRIEPRLNDDEMSDVAAENKETMLALEQIEKSLAGQLPG